MKMMWVVVLLMACATAQTTINTDCTSYANLTTCNSTVYAPPPPADLSFIAHPSSPQIDWTPFYVAAMLRAQQVRYTPYKPPKVKWTKAQKEYKKCSDRARTTDERLKCHL